MEHSMASRRILLTLACHFLDREDRADIPQFSCALMSAWFDVVIVKRFAGWGHCNGIITSRPASPYQVRQPLSTIPQTQSVFSNCRRIHNQDND